MTARDRLNSELSILLDAGHVVACAASGQATSDDATERAQAAQTCIPCPMRGACLELAREEKHKFGVWGGVDFSPSARPAGRPRTEKSA